MIAATRPSRAAKSALEIAVTCWFVAALIGQWAFFYYIVSFYGASTVHGHFETWRKARFLVKGYVPGDTVGNLVFAAHALLAAVVVLTGALQLVPQLRSRAISVHRWNGRVFIVAALCVSAGGLYMVWIRHSTPSVAAAIGVSMNALLVVVFSALAWRAAIRRTISSHRRWALRAYVAANGVWFQRVGVFAWIVLNRGPVGMTRGMNGPFDYFWFYAYFILPLLILELYLHASARAGTRHRFVIAAFMSVATVVMVIGVVGTFLLMWRPILVTL